MARAIDQKATAIDINIMRPAKDSCETTVIQITGGRATVECIMGAEKYSLSPMIAQTT
jgi:hypothetical protein